MSVGIIPIHKKKKNGREEGLKERGKRNKGGGKRRGERGGRGEKKEKGEEEIRTPK